MKWPHKATAGGRDRNALRRLVHHRAFGAVVAQVWQALGSFLLQVAAAHTLGAKGLAMVSLCYGVIILATALSSGMIGDSLTILDRSDPGVRSALRNWASLVVGVAAAVSSVALTATGVLGVVGGLLFFAAVATYMIEDLVRRLHMATMGFWKLFVVDTVALAGTFLIVYAAYNRAALSVDAFLLAIAVGQTMAALVGCLMLPADERHWGPLRGAQMRAVAAFGLWRGAQVGLAPAVQTVARVIITATAGAVALGYVEAARIFMAPALLIVQGLGSYLLSTYANRRASSIESLLRIARRASAAMIAFTLVLGAAAAAVVPLLGGFITGSRFSIDPVIVVGWAVYAAASASLQPFASLAVVRGAQRQILVVRLIDAASALGALWIVLGPLQLGAHVAPYVLAAGQVLGGILVRRLVLMPLRRAGRPQPVGRGFVRWSPVGS